MDRRPASSKNEQSPLIDEQVGAIDPAISRIRSLALFANACRNSSSSSQSEIAESFGVPPPTFSKQLTQLDEYYGVKLRDEAKLNGQKQGSLSPLGKVLGDHALQFWALDTLLRKLLHRTSFEACRNQLGDEFFVDLFSHIEKGALLAISFNEHADKWLNDTSEEYRPEDEIMMEWADGSPVSLADFQKSMEPSGFWIEAPEPRPVGSSPWMGSAKRDERLRATYEELRKKRRQAETEGTTRDTTPTSQDKPK